MHVFCKLLLIGIILLSNYVIAIADTQDRQSRFMSANYIEYDQIEKFIYAEGNIEIILDNYFITANSLIYDVEQDKLWLKGDVRIKDQQNKIIFGEVVILKNKLKEGIISDFILYFSDNTLLVSKLAERINSDLFRLHNSSFTPCKILCNQKPFWQISAKDTEVDLDKNRMIHKHLFFEVYGIPIFYTPYFSHPTPKAKAESGILMPYIKGDALAIPLYYRAKPNLDFTVTPRIFRNYNIYELQARYKPNATDYIILQGNYGKVPYQLKKGSKIEKDRNVNSYYFLGTGDFFNNDYKYGLRLEHASDKAYLTNYYQNFAPYLTSKVYLNRVNGYNYLLMEGLYFDGLQINNKTATNPLIFPRVRTKNIIFLNDNETSSLVIENNSLIFKETNRKELGRISLQIALNNDFLTSSGHLFHLALRNRGDIYFVGHLPYPNDPRANKILTRTIPEIQNIWRYPLTASISDKVNCLVEPIISVTVGRKHNSNRKFAFIDPREYELSENNIFKSNRYAGTDYHEFGNRLDYGINSSVISDQNYLNIFLGQAYDTDKIINKIENVGNIANNFADQIELFYRFRKSKNFDPIRDELGGSFTYKKFQLTAGMVQIANLRKYYFIDQVTTDRVRQFYYKFTYHFMNNWLINYNMTVNCPNNKLNVLSKAIGVTYFNDCARITATISDDYMVDGSRGVKKSSLPTISVGLKILNM